MQELLALRARPTAVLAANDLMAVGAIHAAQAARIDVPRELSIIGFDDLPGSVLVNPSLTTILMSRQEIADQAFRLLFQPYGTVVESVPPPATIRPRLILRDSTARCLARTL